MENQGAQAQATPNLTSDGTNTIGDADIGGSPTSGQRDSTDGQSAIKEAAAEARRKLKIKNEEGAEEEIDEEEVVKVYRERKGHQKAASKILNEGKMAKKQAEEFISMMKDKQKLFDAIKKLGHDPRQLSEEYLASVLEEEMLDPREKELRDYKSKLQKYQDLEKQQKEEAQKRRDLEMKSKFAADYEKQFVDALKTTGLPPTKHMVAEMAKYIHRAAKMEFEMTAVEAAKLVKEDIETAHRNLYGEADAETLVKLIGEQGLQKVRTYDTSRLKDPNAQIKTPKEQGEITRKRESGRRMTPQEWREYNRK